MSRPIQKFLIALIGSAVASSAVAQKDAQVDAGPIFSKFNLTLSPGTRTEAAGPLFYSQQSEAQRQVALPPFGCYTRTSDVDWTEMEILYPIMSYRRFGDEYRTQFFEFFSFYGGQSSPDVPFRQFTVFPFYFRQRSPDTNLDYTAVLPFYGEYKNRLFRDDAKFVMFPLYSETRKRDVVTDNYLYPIFDVRRGDHLKGWQAWPLVGAEHKAPTLRTNMLDKVEVVGGFNKYFGAWPIFIKSQSEIGTTNETKSLTVMPFYSHTQSPTHDEICYGWPMGYDIINDTAKKYSEHDFFWPLYIFSRGSKEETRIFPFYSQSRKHGTSEESLLGEGSLLDILRVSQLATPPTNAPPKFELDDDFYMWPVYKRSRLQTTAVDRQRTRILFFLYSSTSEKHLEENTRYRHIDFLPVGEYRHDYNGNQRWQVLAILEPFFHNNRAIAREYSEIWSFWVSENNPKTGASSQSLLWNFYRHEETPRSKKFSLFFGLIQYESGTEGGRWRVCYIPLQKKSAGTGAQEK